MISIKPIDNTQRRQVVSAVHDYLSQGELLYQRQFEQIPVVFDLKGRAAGMYVSDARRGPRIRFNPYIFAKYFQDNLKTTVPHEVAHYISDSLHGLKNIRPHGQEWRQIMLDFAVNPVRTCNYDLEGVPVRRYRRFSYRCACTSHQLTSRRHNKILQGRMRYACRKCGDFLEWVKPAEEV